MNRHLEELSACQDCGLMQTLPSAKDGGILRCVRCGAVLEQLRKQSVWLSLSAGCIGVALFVLALFTPLADVYMPGGRFATSNLLTAPAALGQTGGWGLTSAVVVTLLVLPVVKLTAVIAMAVGTLLRRVPRWIKTAFSSVPALTSWAMVEVFLLGALIALFRLRDWMFVDFGPALFALTGVAVCSIGIDVALDRQAFWRRVPRLAASNDSDGVPGVALKGCHRCGTVSQVPEGHACPRCERALHTRKTSSIRRTWALVIASSLLAIPAYLLPVMTVTKLGEGGPSTIVGGTVELVQHGFWGLAALVFVASIVIPVAKLGALGTLLVLTRSASPKCLTLRTRVYRLVSSVGRWSMLDIFATMMLVALAHFGWLGTVLPGPGATAFCAVVILTMFASEAFDPRLMWDRAGHNPGPSEPRFCA